MTTKHICLKCYLNLNGLENISTPVSFYQQGYCDNCEEFKHLTVVAETGKQHLTEEQFIQYFAEKMKAKVELRKEKYMAFGWRNRELIYLIEWLHQEIDELLESMDPEEAVDIANLACMIYDKMTQER